MLVLTETTDNLQVVLGAAITTNQLQCVSTYRDITTSAYTPGRNGVDTNSMTDVNIVTSPAASTQRVIDNVSIYNKDTVNAEVTVKLDANSTEYIITKVTLAPAERLEYIDGFGWRVITNAGAIKTSMNQGNSATSSSFTTVILGSDITNNNAIANTIQDVTGLSFSVTNGNKYWFRAVIQYTAALATTGSRWAINGPGGTMRYTSRYSASTTAETNNQGVSAHDSPAACNANSATTASNQAIVEGFYEASSDGNVIIRFASEVAGSAIVAKAGSILMYQQVI